MQTDYQQIIIAANHTLLAITELDSTQGIHATSTQSLLLKLLTKDDFWKFKCILQHEYKTPNKFTPVFQMYLIRRTLNFAVHYISESLAKYNGPKNPGRFSLHG